MSEQPPPQPDQPTPPGSTPPPPAHPQPAAQPGQPHAQPGQPGYPAFQQPGGYPPRAQKKRPRAWWFAVGGVLLVAGIAVGAALFVTAYVKVTEQDGVITADGRPATISAPAGERRMLFVPAGEPAPSCDLADGTGNELVQRSISGERTLDTGGTSWQAFSRVDSTGDGNVAITCSPTTSGDGSQVQVRMGAPLDATTLGGAVIGGLAAIFLLGGAGFVVLLVTTILWFSRRPVRQG